MSKLTQAAQDFLAAKQALEAAEVAKNAAEQALKMEMEAAGVKMTVAGGIKVAIEEKNRIAYDVKKLKDLIGVSDFYTVTKPTVDAELLKAAVAMGHIPQSVVDAIAKTTSYTSIRTTVLNRV
jgi:hypothetical protein